MKVTGRGRGYRYRYMVVVGGSLICQRLPVVVVVVVVVGGGVVDVCVSVTGGRCVWCCHCRWWWCAH